jgi:protein associated with RNAse G/E
VKNLNVLKKVAKDMRNIGATDISEKIKIAIVDLEEFPNSYADLSYSFVMRELRKEDKEKAKEFQKSFKKAFDEGYLAGEDVDNLHQLCLIQALKENDIDPGEFDE